MAQIADSVSRAHDVDNAGALATHLRHIQERTRSVLGGVTTRRNDQSDLRHADMPMHPSLAATTDYRGRRLAGDAFSEEIYR